MSRIKLSWPGGALTATLRDTASSAALLAALPVTGSANTWGEEVYFDIGLRPELEADARQVVEPGTVCLWVQGSSLALPWGPTPISEGDECRLVTAVNVLGMLDDAPSRLAEINPGDAVTVSLLED
jgi:hypothetical protein